MTTDDIEPSTDCMCDLLLQFGIPCRHWIVRCVREGLPIPKTLLHPRWWIQGPIAPANWRPSYSEAATTTPEAMTMTPGERTVLSGLHRVIQAYDGLPDEQQARFGRQVAIRANELLSIASESRALADIPISQPDALQPFKGRKKHSTVNSRLMTAYKS